MKKTKLGIIFGGVSTEHEVSIKSAKAIYKNLNKDKYQISKIYIDKKGNFYESKNFTSLKTNKIDNLTLYLKKIDVVFPVLHGKYGEDGTIQGMFEMLNVPYVGCTILPSALAIDKVYTKIILEKANIKQANYIYIKKEKDKYIYFDRKLNKKEIDINNIEKIVNNKLKYPVFIKPSNSGSSVGITKAKDKEELLKGIKEASIFDNKILIEETLKGKEIECAVLEDGEIKASNLGQIIPDEEFYSYDSKYRNNKTKLIIPADVNTKIEEKIKKIAIKAFNAIDGKGLARIDFFVDKNKIYLNEINTMPGFTEISMYPKLWENTGIKFEDLLDKIIDISLKQNL